MFTKRFTKFSEHVVSTELILPGGKTSFSNGRFRTVYLKSAHGSKEPVVSGVVYYPDFMCTVTLNSQLMPAKAAVLIGKPDAENPESRVVFEIPRTIQKRGNFSLTVKWTDGKITGAKVGREELPIVGSL